MENLPLIKQKQRQFIAQQESVGIGLQTFKQKFVFNQNSGPDAIYLDIYSPSPSSLLGISKKQQNICIFMLSEMLFKAGQMLKLPISTTIVALNIAQYYFTRKSFFDFDLRDIAMGAMFLACKSEETLRRSYQVAAVFDYVFKMYEGQRNIRELELNSLEYNYIKQKVTKTENQILFELGFEVSKLFDIPHRYISGLISSFNKHKQCNLIVQHSWSFLNDIYRTNAPVHYPGQFIASAAIFMALQKLNIPHPDKPWWILMEANLEQIKNICVLTKEMHEASTKSQININIISQILERFGKQQLKISNVLPVPYYRKIRLQNQGLVMKAIQKPIQRIQNQNESSESSAQQQDGTEGRNHRERNKKEKKKNKKKHKTHRNGDRSRSKSKSPQRHKHQTKGKFQNDDQTPKIRNTSFQVSSEIKNNEKQSVKASNGSITHQLQEVGTIKIHAETSQVQNFELKAMSTKKEQTSMKNSVLSSAKSILSKYTQQGKKIEVKNEMVINTAKAQQALISESIIRLNDEPLKSLEREEDNPQKESQSEQEDQLLAELIQIKKKNLQKRQDN